MGSGRNGFGSERVRVSREFHSFISDSAVNSFCFLITDASCNYQTKSVFFYVRKPDCRNRVSCRRRH
ncbi:hypothetical protein HanIR_Chr04g0184871 [Helianthus annuus]|nr:hypothetical protein HanIR_Chr04g0184871 [Helianthus annuus]